MKYLTVLFALMSILAAPLFYIFAHWQLDDVKNVEGFLLKLNIGNLGQSRTVCSNEFFERYPSEFTSEETLKK